MLQVLASSGLWEVMTPQEAVDFVHQCRLCRPDNISCSEALTLEAHTRWKLNFSKVDHSSSAATLVVLMLLSKHKLKACHKSCICRARSASGQDCRQLSLIPVAGHSCKG